MRPLQLLILAGGIAASTAASACVNYIGTDHTGRRFHANDAIGEQLEAQLTTPAVQRIHPSTVQNVIDGVRTNPSFENLNNLGVILLRQGQYTRAIRHFLRVERRFPGHAETAANLGTALELIGHDGVALRWIRIGMRRNPDEHYGTEWLHARILEAKTALNPERQRPIGRSIAGLTFQDRLVPALPTPDATGNSGEPLTPAAVNIALLYQLHERMGFVKPKDPVVANLLMDAATLQLAGGSVENAEVLYDLALRYGAPSTPRIAERRRHIRETLARATDAPPDRSTECPLCLPPPPPPPPPAPRRV